MVTMLPLCCSRSRGGCHSSKQAIAVLLLPLLAQSLLIAFAAPTQKDASQSSQPVTILGVREQCGGLLWSGTLRSGSPMDAPYPQVQCAKGLKCHRDSKWYYECVPETHDRAAWKLESALSGRAEEKTQAGAQDMMDVMDQSLKAKNSHHATMGEQLKRVPEIFKSVLKKEQEVGREVVDVVRRAVNKDASNEHEVKLARTLSAWSTRRKLRNNQAPDNQLYEAVGITPDMTDQYGQCGGKINAPQGISAVDGVWKNGTSDVKCWPGWECKRVNEWYWQCQPIPPPPRPPTFLEVSGVKKLILDPWAQCGGKGGQVPDDEQPVDNPYPGKVCFANTDCTRQNEWYWQCLPNKNFGPVGGGGGGGGGSGDGGNDDVSPSPPPPPSSPVTYPGPPGPTPAYYSSPSQPTQYTPPPGGYPSGYPTGYGSYSPPGGYPSAYSPAPGRRLTVAAVPVSRRLTLAELTGKTLSSLLDAAYEDVDELRRRIL